MNIFATLCTMKYIGRGNSNDVSQKCRQCHLSWAWLAFDRYSAHIVYSANISFHIHRNRESERPTMGSNTNFSFCTQMVRRPFTYLTNRYLIYLYTINILFRTRTCLIKKNGFFFQGTVLNRIFLSDWWTPWLDK